MRINRGNSELHKNFEDQLNLLNQFINSYDEGNSIIYKDIAVKLRVIFHNTKSSHSIVKQLEIVEKLEMLSSATEFRSGNLLAHHGLVVMAFNKDGTQYKPLPRGTLRKMDFQYWWDKEIVIKDKNKKEFSRKKLVLQVANTDGGAHVDPKIDKDYYDLSRDNSLGWTYNDPNRDISGRPLNDPVPPSIRQIGLEALMSFRHNGLIDKK